MKRQYHSSSPLFQPSYLGVWVLFVFSAFGTSDVYADSRTSVVVMPLDSGSLGEEALAVVNEILVVKLSQHDSLKVVTLQDIEAQLGRERMLEVLGCDTVSCATEIGGALNARFLLVGSARVLGNQFIVTLNVIDTENDEVRRSQVKTTNQVDFYERAIITSLNEVFPTRSGATIFKEADLQKPFSNPKSRVPSQNGPENPKDQEVIPASKNQKSARAKVAISEVPFEHPLPGLEGSNTLDLSYNSGFSNSVFIHTGLKITYEIFFSTSVTGFMSGGVYKNRYHDVITGEQGILDYKALKCVEEVALCSGQDSTITPNLPNNTQIAWLSTAGLAWSPLTFQIGDLTGAERDSVLLPYFSIGFGAHGAQTTQVIPDAGTTSYSINSSSAGTRFHLALDVGAKIILGDWFFLRFALTSLHHLDEFDFTSADGITNPTSYVASSSFTECGIGLAF